MAVLEQISALEPVEPELGFGLDNRAIDLPEPPAEVAALTLRIEVDGVVPGVWRQVVVGGDLTLEMLHQVIQHAVGWENSHLHRFWASGDAQPWRSAYFVTDGDLAEGELGTHERDARLDQVLRKPGDQIRYVYDFGDDWFHTIRLEAVGQLAPDAPPALCTGGAMAGPLEDSGGPGGYSDLVEAFSDDPPLARLEGYVREWLPEDWDPTELDLDRVNQRLRGLAAGEDHGSEEFPILSQRENRWPVALEVLQGSVASPVAARISALCVEARAADGSLDEEDLAEIVRPFRYLVELAGQDGIPLTQAGWIKPTVVKQILTDLDLDRPWLARRHQELSTPPVRNLRHTCQELGLLRRRKDRLLVSRQAKALATDRDYVTLITRSLLVHKDPLVTAIHGLFALTLAAGRADGSHDLGVETADLLLACGIHVGTPGEIDPWDVMGVVRTTWMFLHGGTGESDPDGQRHAVALARAALWPDDA
nr:plasmid pRiA4b ORF-3 family protein [Ornithinimicrobium sp. F0845]